MMNGRRDDAIVMTQAAAALHSAGELLTPGREAMVDLSIFVSCYNESEFILDTLETIVAACGQTELNFEIIVIDDVSKDNSAALVEGYIAKHPELKIILRRNGRNRGLAQNYVDGAFLGKGRYYRLICGDNAEPIDTITAVLSQVGKADMLLPYYVTAEGKSWFRRTLSAAFSKLVNLLSGNNIHYYNGLAIHTRHNVMRWHTITRGFGFQAEIICMLLAEGATYQEVAVRTVELKGGKSRALTLRNWLSVAHTLINVVMRRLSNWVYR
jgi:glycosyltransferase involved in cell wall biosynthesis